MKKFLQKILLGMLFFAFPMQIFACALPPDILHEFKINTEQNPITIEYSLQTWDNLRPKVTEILEKNNGNLSENLEKILEEKILENTDLKLENEKISLVFLTGTIISKTDSDA